MCMACKLWSPAQPAAAAARCCLYVLTGVDAQVLLSATMHEKLAQLASLSLHKHVNIGFKYVHL